MKIIPSVVCYIEGREGFLFLKRNHSPDLGKFVPPGGKIEKGEDPVSCVRREIREETGLILGKVKYVGTAIHYGEKEEWIVFIFYSNTFEGKIVSGGEGTLYWIKKDNIYSLDMPPGDKYLLPYIFSDTPFFATFWYNEKEELIEKNIEVV